VHEDAVSVWMQIYKKRSPVGVMLLKQEADRTKDPPPNGGWAAHHSRHKAGAPPLIKLNGSTPEYHKAVAIRSTWQRSRRHGVWHCERSSRSPT